MASIHVSWPILLQIFKVYLYLGFSSSLGFWGSFFLLIRKMNWAPHLYKYRESSMLLQFLRFLRSRAERGGVTFQAVPPPSHLSFCGLCPLLSYFSSVGLSGSSFIPQSLYLRWQVSTERLRGLRAIIEQKEKIQNQILDMVFVQDSFLCGRTCLCSHRACSLLDASPSLPHFVHVPQGPHTSSL